MIYFHVPFELQGIKFLRSRQGNAGCLLSTFLQAKSQCSSTISDVLFHMFESMYVLSRANRWSGAGHCKAYDAGGLNTSL